MISRQLPTSRSRIATRSATPVDLINRFGQMLALFTQVAVNATHHRRVCMSHQLGHSRGIMSLRESVGSKCMSQRVHIHPFLYLQLFAKQIQAFLHFIAIPWPTRRIHKYIFRIRSMRLQKLDQSLHEFTEIDSPRPARYPLCLVITNEETICSHIFPFKLIQLARTSPRSPQCTEQAPQFRTGGPTNLQVGRFRHEIGPRFRAAQLHGSQRVLGEDLLLDTPIKHPLDNTACVVDRCFTPSFLVPSHSVM